MKKNLEILEIEAKLTKDEKKYWRVKTAQGWMSCFDVVAKAALNGLKVACCEVIEKEGKNFKGEDTIFYNITKCYGEAEKSNVIENYGEDEKPEVVKPGEVKIREAETWNEKPRKSVKGSAYEKDPTGLAVDIFCALLNNEPQGVDLVFNKYK